MNPGYLSLLLISIMLILLASGWKEQYARRLPHYGILLFFIGWFALRKLYVTTAQVHLNLTYVWIALICFLVLLVMKGFANKVNLLSVGLLLASFHFLLQEILLMDPILVICKPEWDTALFLALLVQLLQRKPLEQFACLSIAILMGEVYRAAVHLRSMPMLIGGPVFQDQWWLAVFTARTATLLLEAAYGGSRSVVKSLLNRKGGWRK